MPPKVSVRNCGVSCLPCGRSRRICLYVTGQNGGGAFVLAYFVLLLVLAIPGLIAEVGFGRYAGRGVIGAFRKVVTSRGMVGLGVVVLVVNVALMSYLEGCRELLASDEA